jgi:hypothetical protein
MTKPTRESDERILHLVRRRAAGANTVTLAEELGTVKQFAATVTRRVMEADIAESGEPQADVAAHYWPIGHRAPPRKGTTK